MTTIATDGRTMAADGLTNAGGMITSESAQKMWALQDGRIVGCSGPTSDWPMFLEWLQRGGDSPKLDEGFAAIVIQAGALIRVYYNDCTFAEFAGHYAIGTGDRFAITAMDLGRDPSAAIEVAAKRDIYTGGKITALALEQPLQAVA